MVSVKASVGDLLREWRQRRRMSQLELSSEAGISSRHLSFVETGRSLPSREMILHLAEWLNIPLRERNILLTAAGYAPMFAARSLDDPALRSAREAVELILKGHEPYPAIAIDRYWNLVASNSVTTPFLASIPSALLQPPINVLRLSLHPEGMAGRIVNLAEWRGHLLERLRHQIEITADPVLVELMKELAAYPYPKQDALMLNRDYGGIAVPLQLNTQHGLLSLLGTTTVFGTPVDITLAELALETFFPADAKTTEILRGLSPKP